MPFLIEANEFDRIHIASRAAHAREER